MEPQPDLGSLGSEVRPQQWLGCEWGLGRHSGLELGGLASLSKVLGSWQGGCYSVVTWLSEALVSAALAMSRGRRRTTAVAWSSGGSCPPFIDALGSSGTTVVMGPQKR